MNNSIFNTTGHKYQKIACNNCWGCQLQKSAEWATRIILECEETKNSTPIWDEKKKKILHPSNYFITFTYDDEHLHKPEELVDETTGKVYKNDGTWQGGILVENDMKEMFNSMRKYFERKGHVGIKYYYCGEYGENTHRSHFHAIIMNLPLDITEFYDTHIDKNFKAHWKSHEVEKWWNKGMIDIAEVEWSCAAYVARYTMKKLGKTKDTEYYYSQGKTPEFVRMSNRPGIGRRYYERNKDKIYERDEIIQRTVKGNVGSIKPPKAWDKKFKEEFPKEWEKIKKSRENAIKRSNRITREITDYTDYETLKIKAERISQKQKMLPRPGEW